MIELAVTTEFVRAGSTAFGVEAAVHHDPAAARAAGLADIIVSTPHLGALVERFVLENWGARIGDLRLTMRRPVCAGTTVTISGTATHRGWEVAISAGDDLLVHATCS
ncbi:MAG: hypothetical protein GX868_18245 [Actinobacteria bacterium]|nr:hypothetical protein [Actinomycetota bacterium]